MKLRTGKARLADAGLIRATDKKKKRPMSMMPRRPKESACPVQCSLKAELRTCTRHQAKFDHFVIQCEKYLLFQHNLSPVDARRSYGTRILTDATEKIRICP